jgi:hypothetical protein
MELFNAVATDLPRALRSVLRDPMHSIGIVSILVLGIGANAAAFGMVKSVLLDPLPFDDLEQLVLAWPAVRHTPAGVRELRALPGFIRGAGFRGRDLTLLDVGFPKPVEGAVVWSNYFALLGSEPVLGREAWLPAILDPTDEAYQSSGTYRILERLSPGVDAVPAERQVAALARRWQSAAPDRWSDESIRSARVVPLAEDIIGEARSGLLLAFVSVLVLLLIACAGISNLVLSKAVVRRRERWIMAAQIALALPLSLAAGLLLTSVFELRRVDPGFEASGLLTLSSTPTLDSYEEPASRITLVEAVAARLRALPHVTSVGAIQTLPLMGSSWEAPYVAEGNPVPEGQSTPVASLRVITPGYLEAMRIGLVAGRPPSEADHAEAQPVGWINRALADHLWPGESAVGKSIL